MVDPRILDEAETNIMAEARQMERRCQLAELSVAALQQEVAKHKRISRERLGRAKAAEDVIKHLRKQLGHPTHGRKRKLTPEV